MVYGKYTRSGKDGGSLKHSSAHGSSIRYCTMMGTQGTAIGTVQKDYKLLNIIFFEYRRMQS